MVCVAGEISFARPLRTRAHKSEEPTHEFLRISSAQTAYFGHFLVFAQPTTMTNIRVLFQCMSVLVCVSQALSGAEKLESALAAKETTLVAKEAALRQVIARCMYCAVGFILRWSLHVCVCVHL